MAKGSKKAYSTKQRRQAKHIEDSEKESGKSTKRAEQIAYATINKQDGGGKKSGSGRKKSKKKAAPKKKTTRKKARKKSSAKKAAKKSTRR